MAMTLRHAFVMLLALMLVLDERQADGAVSAEVQKLIHEAKLNGPYVGVVIPNLFELSPLLHNPNFTSANFTIPFSGRRFRFGAIGEKRVILVMTGLSLINAGITTQLLLTLFKIEGVVHYGIAVNANPSLNIGDVTIPKYWSQTSLWYWQRYGDGPSDELTLESNGDYTRELGFLKFANFTTNDLKLEGCLNSTTCLDEQPRVVTVQRGTSGSVFLDNAAYRSFIYSKFNVSPVDMESASVALICLQQRVPFIIIRALSDLAGGGSAESNEADIFTSLAANNAVTVVMEFIKQLSA
ncbi:Phosphorylase superfamily protein isoform 2 [Theobroma cacao]|uniref:Phosphorylase superfamily protein isoform 2 n=1 Tax=Theobroma cacao TaxID=3641 RepID=A0A061GJN3_THECC|nr:Phosphorylase superfamily protein isoform 2 [Theobroma cacao]